MLCRKELEIKGPRLLRISGDNKPVMRNKWPLFDLMDSAKNSGVEYICSCCERDAEKFCDLIVGKGASICEECLALCKELVDYQPI